MNIEEKNNPKIQHAPIGAAVCTKWYGISDNEIMLKKLFKEIKGIDI